MQQASVNSASLTGWSLNNSSRPVVRSVFRTLTLVLSQRNATAWSIVRCFILCSFINYRRNTASQIMVCSVPYHRNTATCLLSDMSALATRFAADPPACWCVNVWCSSKRYNILYLLYCANGRQRHYTDSVMSSAQTCSYDVTPSEFP